MVRTPVPNSRGNQKIFSLGGPEIWEGSWDPKRHYFIYLVCFVGLIISKSIYSFIHLL